MMAEAVISEERISGRGSRRSVFTRQSYRSPEQPEQQHSACTESQALSRGAHISSSVSALPASSPVTSHLVIPNPSAKADEVRELNQKAVGVLSVRSPGRSAPEISLENLFLSLSP